MCLKLSARQFAQRKSVPRARTREIDLKCSYIMRGLPLLLDQQRGRRRTVSDISDTWHIPGTRQ